MDRDTVRGGTDFAGKISLNGAAWELGAKVFLTSSDPAVQVPSTVTVAENAYEVSFSAPTLPVRAQKKVTLTASLNGQQTSRELTLEPPPPVSSVRVNPVLPEANTGSTVGYVNLAGKGGRVELSSSDPAVAWVPSEVVVPAGSEWTWFTVTLLPVSVDTAVTISATSKDREDRVTQTTTLIVPAPPAAPPGPPGHAMFLDAGCNANALPANDNGSTGSVTLPFQLNFNGSIYDHVFVNNNGNVTFKNPRDWTYAWELFQGYEFMTETTIAPFYADVDTRGAGSDVVRYGAVTFEGRTAFCVNWVNVGYFDGHSDKRNSFQLLLVDRSDVGERDFDIYMNYGSIQWDCSDNFYCQHGVSTAWAGYWVVHGPYSQSVVRLPGSFNRGVFLDDSGSPYSLIHGARNSPLPGRYIFPIRNGGGATGGKLSGRVTNTSGSLMGRAPVEVCRVSEGPAVSEGPCKVAYTDGALGTYSVSGLLAGNYTVTAHPPLGSNARRQTVGPVPVTAGAQLAVNVTLPPATPMPVAASLAPSTAGGNGIPIVDAHEPLDLSVPGCAGGAATYSVESGGTVLASGPMLESPEGTYIDRVTPLHPNTGPAQVIVNIDCPSSALQAVAPSAPRTVAFDIYIAPSSAVRTLQGRPVPDAWVTLYRSDKPEGPFTVVPSGSAIMSPINRANPDVTDTQGRFRWDVIAGHYKVRAEREGCLSPSGAPYVETEVLSVPPRFADLELRLDCPELDDHTPPSSSVSVSPPANANGWHNDEVRLGFTATDDDSGVNLFLYTLSGAQSGGAIEYGPRAQALIATEGVTTVSWFARDEASNLEAAHSLQVRIDQTAPSSSASLAPLANANGWHKTPVTIQLGATDGASGVEHIVYTLTGAQSGAATVSGGSASVTIFTEGTTTLTWYARDLAGNEETAHSLQIRIDMTPPTLSCEASPAVLSPPNHKLIPVQVHALIDGAAVGSGGAVNLLSVTSSEADNGLGDGDMPGDLQGWERGTADTQGLLRAERSGSGSGRTYTLSYEGSDLAGNLATCVTTVSVPHDKR